MSPQSRIKCGSVSGESNAAVMITNMKMVAGSDSDIGGVALGSETPSHRTEDQEL